MNLKERFNIVCLDGQAHRDHLFIQQRRLHFGFVCFFPCGNIAIDSNHNKAGTIPSKITSKVH